MVPTPKQEANTRKRTEQVQVIIADHFHLDTPTQHYGLATKIVTAIEDPILALLREEERSRTRLNRLVKAQERLTDAYRRQQAPASIAMREDAVKRCRDACERHGDFLSLDLPPEKDAK